MGTRGMKRPSSSLQRALIILSQYFARCAYQLNLDRKFQPDGDGDPKAFFNDTFNCLRLPNTDILLIVDCCFAAHAFAAEGLGKRKYELIVSSSHDGDDAYVPAPKHPDSFTRRLCDTMEEMLQSPKYSNGFSTADLYRSVYHKQHAPKHDSDRVRHDIKPLLFDQSLFDYGRIWLRPHFTASESPSSVQKPKITINLTLRMVEMPNAAIMNEVARALQYVPHTEEITFEKLHAPQAEIQEFFYGMQRAMYIKRIMRKLRLRLEKRKREQEGGPTDQELKLRPSLRLDTKPDVSRSYDWSGAQAYLRDGTKLPVSMATGKQATRSPVADDDHGRMERLREWKASSEGGNQFSYTWSLDLPNLKNLAYRPWRHMVTRVMKPNADRVAGEPWPKFENHAFVLDEDEADAPVMNGVESFDIFMFAAIVVALGCILHASS